MPMKRFSLIAALVFLPSLLFAGTWKVGLGAGMTVDFLQTSTGAHSSNEYSPYPGFSVSLSAAYDFLPYVGLESGFSLVQKSYKWENTASGDVNYDQNLFGEIPLWVMGYLPFGVRDITVSPYLGAGAWIGYWFLHHRKGSMKSTNYESASDLTNPSYSYSENVDFDDDTDNRFEWGLGLRTGVDVAIGRWIVRADFS